MTLEINNYISLIENIINRSPSHIVGGRKADAEYIKVHTRHFLKILNNIPDDKPQRILDIGVTPNTFAIKQLHPSSEVCAIDITDYMEEGCKEFEVRFNVCNLERDAIPYPDDYFDIVIFTEVMEHLFARPSDVLNKIKRVLRPSGLLIFTVPNIATLIKRIRLLLGISPLSSLDDVIKPGRIQEIGHIHEYTMHEMQSVLQLSGFEITHKEYYTVLGNTSYLPTFAGLKIVCLISIQKICMYLIPSFRTTIFILAKKQ